MVINRGRRRQCGPGHPDGWDEPLGFTYHKCLLCLTPNLCIRPVFPFALVDRVSQSTRPQQPSAKPNRHPKPNNGQSPHSQTLNDERRETRVSTIISQPNSQSPRGDGRDHDIELIETGSWPSPVVDPWGGLLPHNEGPGLSLDDNTDLPLFSPVGWENKFLSTGFNSKNWSPTQHEKEVLLHHA